MRVDKTQIYLNDEDELIAVEVALVSWEEQWEGAKWMFLPREWAEYVQGKVALKKRLRKIKERMEYNNTVSD